MATSAFPAKSMTWALSPTSITILGILLLFHSDLELRAKSLSLDRILTASDICLLIADLCDPSTLILNDSSLLVISSMCCSAMCFTRALLVSTLLRAVQCSACLWCALRPDSPIYLAVLSSFSQSMQSIS